MILQPQRTSSNDQINHSESNPILNAPVISNDRVKLEKLNHIPSVKSNLISQGGDTNSQTDLINNPKELNKGTSINYENMPVGKKSILAPLQNPVSPLIGGGKEL